MRYISIAAKGKAPSIADQTGTNNKVLGHGFEKLALSVRNVLYPMNVHFTPWTAHDLSIYIYIYLSIYCIWCTVGRLDPNLPF